MEQGIMQPSRRSFLKHLACAGLAGAGFLPSASAQAQAFPQFFSSLDVDVDVLRARGLGPYADFLGDAVLAELRRSFADRIDPRGPRLVVRLTSILMSTVNRSRFDGWSGGGTDYLEGEALAVGSGGAVLARHPQLAALDTRADSREPNEQGRTIELARHYVRWLRRRI